MLGHIALAIPGNITMFFRFDDSHRNWDRFIKTKRLQCRW